MNPIQAVSSGFRGYVDFKGRSSRSEYWWWFLFVMIVNIAGMILDALLGTLMAFYLLAGLGLLLANLAVSVRRLHDLGRSGYWLLISFVPVIGSILLIVWYAKRRNEGTNNYGPHPSTKLDYGTTSVSGEGGRFSLARPESRLSLTLPERFCSNCGVALGDDVKFCPSCGTQV